MKSYPPGLEIIVYTYIDESGDIGFNLFDPKQANWARFQLVFLR